MDVRSMFVCCTCVGCLMMGWLICPTSVWRLSKHRPTIKFMSHESQFCPILSVKLIMLAPSCHKKYLKHSFISSTHLESYSYNLPRSTLYGSFKILELSKLWLGLVSNFYLQISGSVCLGELAFYILHFTYAYMETMSFQISSPCLAHWYGNMAYAFVFISILSSNLVWVITILLSIQRNNLFNILLFYFLAELYKPCLSMLIQFLKISQSNLDYQVFMM